ncbi:MAG: hypothetical protein KatS3mg095_0912 [Candidatus Parcubacteria bacterium]|nr:MAG: hypothetical protein KatS3mg095_0912 [Candidatus Parcubacteria bacterium]
MEDYGKLILRIGLGIVFLYFGVSQLISPQRWIDLIPEVKFIYMNDIFKQKIILMNGVFDCLIGLCFILGIFIKLISLLATLHLISIFIFSLGFTPSGFRDLGLALASLSLFFLGDGKFNLKKILNVKNKRENN